MLKIRLIAVFISGFDYIIDLIYLICYTYKIHVGNYKRTICLGTEEIISSNSENSDFYIVLDAFYIKRKKDS